MRSVGAGRSASRAALERIDTSSAEVGANDCAMERAMLAIERREESSSSDEISTLAMVIGAAPQSMLAGGNISLPTARNAGMANEAAAGADAGAAARTPGVDSDRERKRLRIGGGSRAVGLLGFA